MSQIDDFLDGKAAPSAAPKVSAIDAFLGEDKPKQNKGLASDVLTAVKQGALQLPGGATGILDIAPGALGIDRPASKAADFLGSMTGFQPGKWAKEANAEYSPETQQAKSAVDQAWDDPNKGAADVAAAYLKNPRTIGLAAAQSIPSMLAGGLVGRGIGMAAGIKSAAARAAIGEGSVMAGSTMDQIDASVDPQKAAAASLVVGAGGTAIGAGGAKIASRFGNVDIDSAIAGGVTAPTGKTMSLAKRVPAGILQEGLLEEAPQTALETGAQNWAEGKPLTEGMARNVTEGALAGGLMGGGAAALTRQQQAQGLPDPDAGQPPAQPPAPALGYNPKAGTHTVFPDGSVILNSDTPAGEQAVFDKRFAPQPVKPSEAMGIDPNAGVLSRTAAEAVDGPASMEMAVRQAERDMAALAAEDNPEAGADARPTFNDPLEAQVAGYVAEMGTASPQMVAAKFGVTIPRATELLALADPTVDDLFPPPKGAANVSNADTAGPLATGTGGRVGADTTGGQPDAGLLGLDGGRAGAGTAGAPAPSVQESVAAPVSGRDSDTALIKGPINTKAKVKGLKDVIARNKAAKQADKLPRVDVRAGKESKANARAQQSRDQADSMGVTGDMYALLQQGMDANEVEKALGDRLNSVDRWQRGIFIQNVQATLGIPFKKTTANVQNQPQGTAPAAAPSPAEAVQAPQAVGSDGVTESGAAPAGRAGVEAAGVVPASTDATGKRASWVIRNKDTGEVVMETFDPAKVQALNAAKYEAVPVKEYLASLNKKTPSPPTTTEPTNAPRSPEAAQAVETTPQGREETALLSESVSTEPNLEAAKALLARQRAATGNAVAEGKVRKELRDLAAKTPETDTKTVLALDTAATRLGMGEGRLKGLEFKQAESSRLKRDLSGPAPAAAPAVAAPAPDNKPDPAVREKLMAIAKRLGVIVNTVNGGFKAGGGAVDIPVEDAQVEGALSPNHVAAHELGHAAMQKRGMSFQGHPIGKIKEIFIPNWDALVAASKAFRPAVWASESLRIKNHARKPNEVIADAIGSVYLGLNDVSLLEPMMKRTGTTVYALGLEDAPAPSQQAQAPAEPQEITHNGTRIYRTRTKLGDEVKAMWAVETPENKARRAAGERTLGGDTLHNTIDQAKAAADREAKEYADRKAFAEQQDAEERARKEADEARKASNRGKSIAERRKETVLDGQTKLPASAGLGNTTRRNAMQMAVDQGRAVVERQVDDTAAKKRDQEAIDRVRRAGYMLGLSNENIPVVKAGLEAQARLKANDYKKPEYRVYAGSEPTGGFFEITKIEYEYAQELMAQKAAKPAVAPAPEPATQADEFLPDGWTMQRIMNGYGPRVYRFEQDLGQPFAVVTQVEGMKYEVQIRHGAKQLTISTQRGALSEVLAGAKAELAKMTQAASVTHQDPGEKPEAATKGVVNDSLKTAAKNEDTKPSEMRKWLLAEIDKELLQAPDRADYDEAVKTMGEKDAISMYTGNGMLGKNTETGFITFDVPGDGKFKVRNSVRGLLEFRKTVNSSLGFKDSGQKTLKPEQNDGVQGGSGGQMAAVTNMIEEGDFEAARDYAEAVGIKLEDVKVPRGDMKPAWEKYLKDGTVPPPPNTAPLPEKKTAAQENAEKLEAEEAERRRPKDTGWNMAGTGYGGKRYTGRNITLDDGRQVVARIYENAGTYEEAEVKEGSKVLLRLTDRYRAQERVDAWLDRLMGKTPALDLMGFKMEPMDDDGSFRLLDGNMVVSVERTDTGLQARHRSAKSSPRLTDQQAVEWAANIRDESKKAQAAPAAQPAIPDGYKPAGEPFYRDGKLTQGYAPFDIGQRVTMKESGGQSGVIDLFTSPDDGGVFSGAMVKFDNGVEQIVKLNKLEAEAAPAAAGPRRDPANVSMFNPYNDGDIVTIDGQDWTVKQDTPGWYLTTNGNWRGQHPTIRNVKAMADLIRAVEQAATAPAPAADTPKLTQAEAKDLMEWQDLGQKDGIKTHILTFYESKADKDAKRGRMTVATVSKEVDAKQWVVEGTDDRLAMLGAAKKKAEEVGMAKAVADGFVEEVNPFAEYDAVAKQYGYEVRPDGMIGSDGKFPGPKMAVQRGRLRVESGAGNLLGSYAATPESIGKFLEAFWYAEKKAVRGSAPAQQEAKNPTEAAADGFVEPAAALEAPKKGLAGARAKKAAEAQQEQSAQPAAGVVENFGEKLPPARRAMAAKLSEALSDDNIAKLPLSQIWPASENEAIEDTFAAAVAHVMREAIPAKPRTAYKVNSWVNKVKMLRDFAAKILRGTVSKDFFMEEMSKFSALRDLRTKIKLLEQIDRAQWKRIGDVSEAPNAMRYEEGKPIPMPSVSVAVDGKSHWLRESGDVLTHLDAIKAMLGTDAPENKMQFEIRQESRGDRKVFINKKGDKEYRRLMEFATVDEARKALKEQYADLVAAWEGVKGRDNITERDLRSDTNRDRTGKDHRKGRDVTAEEFESKFGFRGGEFGKWVGQGKAAQDRQFMLNSAYDALMDLSDLLGISPKAISLEGSLGIAFGSRGSGWASAHFEPSNLVINLTKTRGAGALAHEWFHALDNYFARKRGGEVAFTGDQNAYRRDNFITYKTAPLMVRKDGKGTPLTKERLAEWRKSSPESRYLSAENWMEDPNHKQGVRAEVEQAFADLVKTLNDSPMLKRARVLDGVKEAEGYWSRIIEMAARSFENYVQTRMMEQGYHNDFLANVKEAPEVGKNVERYPYLLPSEIAPVADAFKALFDTIQTKQDDAGNVAMFSRAQAPASGIPVQTAQQIVDTIKARWKNAPEVIVLADMNDPRVPEAVRKGDAEQRSGGATGEPEGFYYKGTAYVVAGSLKTPGDVVRVLLHESLGHHGLRGVFGDGLKTILKQIATMRKSEVQAKAAEYGLDMEKESDRLQAAEEVLAVMAQNNPQAGFVKRAIGAIRAWLRENVPMFANMRLSDNDIVTQFILPARRFVQQGPAARVGDGVLAMSRSAGDVTDTPAFRKWFGDSKVVDADGKPLVVYHGTSRDFDTFRDGDGAAGKGIYFSPDARIAGNYAAVNGSAGARVLPVYLSIANPFMLKETDTVPSRKVLERRGYDGVIYTHSWNDGTVATEYIAFRPEQIKSAIGNNGQFDPENPDIRFSRSPRELAGMATDQVNTALKSVTITSIKQAAGYKATDLMGIALGGLGRRQLVEIYGKDLPLDKYNELATQMEADKNEYGAEADTIATEWGKLKDEGALANIMHDATLAKIDPDKPLQPGDDPAAYNALKMRFSLMSKEAKETYRKARDGYKRHHANVREAIKERIERSQMSPERRAALVERMDSEFFAAMKGVYFPLARFGKYVVVVRGADGKVETVARSETMAEAAALRRNLVAGFPAAKGYQVDKVILSREFVASRDAVGRGFMQELYQVLDKQDMDPAMRAEMEDTLGQLYLSSLPDVSWAKHGIHRKGTPGFSQDARRAFAQNMFHGARYLAKLRYSDLMQTELKAMQDHVDKIGNVLPDEDGFNGPRMQRVVDEFYKRHDSLMNPNSHPLSTALTSIGFMFHLGLSPASALVNLTQTAFVAYPVMAAKWGFGKAGVALLKASKQAAMGRNDITKFLNRDERRAYDQAVKDGTIDVTQAHDLAGIAQGEDAGVMWRIRPAMRAASFLFHHAERFNRQATFVAAYRLAREAGTTHEAAFEQATKATYDGHYDYSAGNRPRFMQGNAAKVILLFKSYAQNMVYTLARNAYQSVNGLDPKERAEARKALAGILATHAMAAGVLGLPMVTTILAAISAAGSDDDEPFDAQVALQNMLADTFGQKPAEVITRGLSRLTPWDISGRVGLDRLIFPDVQEGLEGQRLAESAAFAALGPVAGIGLNILKGIQEIGDGHMLRGITTMMPAALRGPLNAVRLSNEGAQDKTGIPIVDEVDAAAVFGQALGFSPSVVRQATEGKRAVLSYDRALNERRQELMTQYARGAMKQDTDAMQEAREAIQAFNEKNPGRRITMMQLSQSVRNRERRIDQADNGVYLPKNRREAMDQGRFALSE